MNKYGISDLEYEIILKQIERRKKHREEFLRLRSDPHQQASEAGHVFDPALQRFISMKATQLEYFKPNPRTIFIGLAFLFPMVSFGCLVYYDRSKFLEKCSTGQIRYRDRDFKFK